MISGCGEVSKPEPDNLPELTLRDYPELFKENTMIIIGAKASEIEQETAEKMKTELAETSENTPILKKDNEVSTEDKKNYNLIILGTPGTNEILDEVRQLAEVIEVSGEYKGVLEITNNPWNTDKTTLIVAGNDKWGVRVGELMLSGGILEGNNKVGTDWREYTGVEFPLDNKEEVIKYVKTDPDVIRYIAEWQAEGYETGIWAEWDTIEEVWEVGISPVGNIRDILFLLHVKRDGTILDKGIVPAA